MTTPRSEVFDPNRSGFYHCISRCVRRAFLCGFDKYLSKSFEHRKEWAKQRLAVLVEIFAIECLAYAIMSNHFHTLLYNCPALAAAWSAEEVAIRWRKLFPRRRDLAGNPMVPSAAEIEEIVSDPQRVEVLRERLSSISWFNRCLNENLARRANAEDECEGRFWQGRFKCILLDNEAAVLACSAYIDLNPVRARIAETLEGSHYTSIQDRIATLQNGAGTLSSMRLMSHEGLYNGQINAANYIALVEETGRILKEGKGSISPHLAPLLERLGIKPKGWLENATSHTRIFHRVMAPVERMRELAVAKGKSWFSGMDAARVVFA